MVIPAKREWIQGINASAQHFCPSAHLKMGTAWDSRLTPTHHEKSGGGSDEIESHILSNSSTMKQCSLVGAIHLSVLVVVNKSYSVANRYMYRRKFPLNEWLKQSLDGDITYKSPRHRLQQQMQAVMQSLSDAHYDFHLHAEECMPMLMISSILSLWLRLWNHKYAVAIRHSWHKRLG